MELAGFPSILHVQEKQGTDLRCRGSLDVMMLSCVLSDLPNGGGAIQQGQQDFAIVSALLPSIPSLGLNKPSEGELIHKNRDRIADSVLLTDQLQWTHFSELLDL